MAQFIRCIEGHVFDAGTATVCPICGAVVEFTLPVEATPPGTPIADGTGVAASAMLRTPVLGAVAAAVLCVGIAALFFALRETRPATTNKASASAVASLSASQLGGPLQMALFVTRMLTAFEEKNYSDALSQAEALAANNNPVGMRVEAQILLDGLAGRKDPVQARALLTSAVKLGDPSSALSLARLSEQGIGGPQNFSDIRFYYLEAAQANVPGADAELVRLHLDDVRLMTVMQAYRTVMTSAPTAKETLKAVSVFAGLSQGGSTPATCLSALLIPKYLANGWNVVDNFKGSSQGESAEGVQYRSFSYGVDRADAWCEWGMAKLRAKDIAGHPKDLVTADAFYRLAVTNGQLGSGLDQAKQELAAVEAQMTPAEKARADNLLSGVVDDISAAVPANSVAATTPAAAPVNSEANGNTAPPSTSQASQTPSEANGEPSASPNVAISDTLRTTLDVVRMLVAFGQKDYANASSLADNLIKENNPIGMFIKAGLFMDGLGGQPKDLSQARDLLAKATRLGDPTSALFYARVLENGIGGPRDLDAAKENYLFAARGMTAGADQDIGRLHLSGDVGMTALQAYQNLVSPRRTKDALARFNDLMRAYSTSAVCLYGWIYSQAEALHWTATRGSGDIAQLHGVDAKKMSAPPSDAGGQPISADAQEVQLQQLHYFAFGAARSDPWCEWGMAMRAATGSTAYPKNLVEADVFYRLAIINTKLGSGVGQVKQELAAVEGQMTPHEQQQADSLFHGAVPVGMAP